MRRSTRPRVKICCISSPEEASLAIELGASALGLVSAMPSGPGPIPESLIARIAAGVPPGVATFLLTSKQDSGSIIEQQHRTRVNTIQLVDEVPQAVYSELRMAMPGVSLVQVVHVRDERSIDEALAVSEHVDAVLLDSGNPSLAVKELGGTGRVHDWRISRRIREMLEIPVYLAGGLNPDNVRNAIEEVWPFGVDLCNGVRTNGKLDREKLGRFMERVGGVES